MIYRTCITSIIFFLFLLINFPTVVFAEETGFRSPTTCSTDGSSCENMQVQDNNYNFWSNTYSEEVQTTFTDFGIPNNAIIDDIQIKLRIKTSSSGWTWFFSASPNNGNTYYAPEGCTHFGGSCRYNTNTFFNSIESPTVTWINSSPYYTFTGKDINSSDFRFRLWQSTGAKNTDIDTLLFNIRYHLEPSLTISKTTDWIFANNLMHGSDYTNLSNVLDRDGQIATANSGSGLLRLTNFDPVDLPSDAEIKKVEMRFNLAGVQTTYRFQHNNNDCRDNTRPGYYKGFSTNSTTILEDYIVDYTDQDCAFSEAFIKEGNYAVEMVRYSVLATYKIDDISVRFTYLTSEPTPTPTSTPIPTPTSSPTPEPFLDLPYDYQASGKTFNEVALNPESWFDHQYPLQNVLCCVQKVMIYTGQEKSLPYRSHAGYDYALKNGVDYLTPVHAAAAGVAEFKPENKTGGLGNTIKIDHGNGYQTWYGHLDSQGLIVSTEGVTVPVQQGQEIGKTGYTGNIFPKNKYGAHIHFAVFKDENKNANFNDDYPVGLTDPLGWEGENKDPWTEYRDNERNGVTSYNLFNPRTMPQSESIPQTGGIWESADRGIKVIVASNAASVPFTLKYKHGPYESFSTDSKSIESVAPSFFLNAVTTIGDKLTQFYQPIRIIYHYSNADLLNFKQNTLLIYYFNEQLNEWEALPSTVDTENKTVTAETTHFSQFALMAEVKDNQAPNTTIKLNGHKGQSNWYRSSVSVDLVADDGEDSSGVKETLYTINGKDWFTYTTPLNFENDGEYNITYQSIDNTGNLENQQSKTFHIDKTPPEAEIEYDLSKFDAVIKGKDNESNVIVSITNSSYQPRYTITDEAGNQLVINTNKVKIGKQVTLTIRSIQYNADPVINLDRNIFFNLVLTDKSNKVRQLDQYFSMKGDKKIFTSYSSQENETKIFTKNLGNGYTQESKSGVVLLKLLTKNGNILSEY